MGKDLSLAIKIGGKVAPSLKGSVDDANSTLAKIGSGAAKVGKIAAASMAAIGTAAIAGAKQLIDLGNGFQDAYNTIRIGTGATGDDLAGLEDSMKAVYSSVPTDMGNAAQAIADYNTRLGLTGDTLEEMSQQAIQVNKMLGDDLGGVIEQSSKAFQQWNISEEEMSDKMDYLFKASQSTGVGFTDLAKYAQQYGAQLQELGYGFDESVALIGQLDKAGVNMSETLSAMKKSVGTLAKEGYDAGEGFDVYTQKIMEAKDMTEATALANKIFGTKAGSTMAAAIRNGTISVDELTASLQATSETINGCATDTYTFSDKLQMFKQKAQVALEPLAMTLLDSLNELLPTVGNMIEALTPIISDVAGELSGMISDFLPMIIDVAQELISSLMPVLQQVISDILPPMMGILKAIMPLVSKVISSLLPPLLNVVTALLPPLTQIIEAVLPVFIQLIDALLPSFEVIVGTVLPLIAQLIQAIMPLVTSIINVLLPPLLELIEYLLPPLIQLSVSLLPVMIQLINTIMPVLLTLIDVISPILNLVIDLIDPILQVLDAFTPLIEVLGNLLSNILEPIMPLIEMLADLFKTVLGPALDVVTGLFDGMANAISSVFGWIGNIAGSIGDFFGGLFGGGDIDVAVNAVSNGEELPQFATGGIVTGPTKAIIGEGGEPEAIIPLSKFDDIVGGSAQGDIVFAPVFNFSGNVSKADIDEASDEMFEQFKDLMARYQKEVRRTVF